VAKTKSPASGQNGLEDDCLLKFCAVISDRNMQTLGEKFYPQLCTVGTQNMDATYFSKHVDIFCQSTWRHIPEKNNIHFHCCENGRIGATCTDEGRGVENLQNGDWRGRIKVITRRNSARMLLCIHTWIILELNLVTRLRKRNITAHQGWKLA
jgi:hypothetical protein